MAQLRELRDDYSEWHRAGMRALEKNDLQALEAAIKAERDIIDKQSALLRDLGRPSALDSFGAHRGH